MKKPHAAGMIFGLGFSIYACGGSSLSSRTPPPEIPVVKNNETPSERPLSRQSDDQSAKRSNSSTGTKKPLDSDSQEDEDDQSLKQQIKSQKWKGCCPGASMFSSAGNSTGEKVWKNVAFVKIKSFSFRDLDKSPVKTEKILGGYFQDAGCRQELSAAELKNLGLTNDGDQIQTQSIADLDFLDDGRQAKGFHVLYEGTLGGKKEKTIQPVKLEINDDQLIYTIIYEPNEGIGDTKGFKQECVLDTL